MNKEGDVEFEIEDDSPLSDLEDDGMWECDMEAFTFEEEILNQYWLRRVMLSLKMRKKSHIRANESWWRRKLIDGYWICLSEY